MALAMALKASRVVVDGGRKVIERIYDVTFTGSYANSGAGGDVIDFTGVSTTLSNPNLLERGLFANVPTEMDVMNSPAGYQISVNIGTLLTNWGLTIWDIHAGAELSNGAYPAALTGITAGVRIAFREPAK